MEGLEVGVGDVGDVEAFGAPGGDDDRVELGVFGCDVDFGRLAVGCRCELGLFFLLLAVSNKRVYLPGE